MQRKDWNTADILPDPGFDKQFMPRKQFVNLRKIALETLNEFSEASESVLVSQKKYI